MVWAFADDAGITFHAGRLHRDGRGQLDAPQHGVLVLRSAAGAERAGDENRCNQSFHFFLSVFNDYFLFRCKVLYLSEVSYRRME